SIAIQEPVCITGPPEPGRKLVSLDCPIDPLECAFGNPQGMYSIIRSNLDRLVGLVHNVRMNEANRYGQSFISHTNSRIQQDRNGLLLHGEPPSCVCCHCHDNTLIAQCQEETKKAAAPFCGRGLVCASVLVALQRATSTLRTKFPRGFRRRAHTK